jgi:hypothetical protein
MILHPGQAARLAPRGAKREARYAYYAALTSQVGLPPSRLTVIGFRGLAPEGRRHSSADNASDYDDTFVLLDPVRRKAWELLGSTHAGQQSSTLAPAGVAQIQPGLYRAEPCGLFADMHSWLLTTRKGEERLPCWRDSDADGLIGPAERRAASTATEILFHNGRYNDHGSSIGCQVLPPAGMRELIRIVGSRNGFDYLLLDANRPLRRAG